VRCGNNNKSVIICHGTGSATNPYTTLCVGKTETNSHFLNHPGEQLGPCGMVKTCNWPVQERLETEGLQDGMEYIGAFPNPFSNTTTIRFMLPENDFANVKVFDVTGRVVENIYEGETKAGNIYDVTFDGSKFSNGIYFLLLNSRSGVSQTRKLILSK
ncbi:MAG TPA: T9SS type A sorting domain-containing protein, partial [Bacteroidia bacterium]|nr:T9SS type A sorting domain-containing protein [Bacteroidia bacterium]